MIDLARRRDLLDRMAIALSGLCAVHCLATTVLVALVASAGNLFANPLIHEVGLALAVALGAVALGLGWRTHGRRLPMLVGSIGLALMACALMVPHGTGETILTLLGVGVLSLGHVLNRHSHTHSHSPAA